MDKIEKLQELMNEATKKLVQPYRTEILEQQFSGFLKTAEYKRLELQAFKEVNR